LRALLENVQTSRRDRTSIVSGEFGSTHVPWRAEQALTRRAVAAAATTVVGFRGARIATISVRQINPIGRSTSVDIIR